MFTQFFGQFLLNNDLVSAEELNIVFQNIKSTRLRLGMIAIDEGFLTPTQVVVINNLQKKHDKRFGEIAVEFDYLTEVNLEKILNMQQSEHLKMAQTIVDLGYMTLEEFAEALNTYKRYYGISDESFDELKNGKVDEVIYNIINTENQVIKEYVTLFYKNIIRFITNEVYISEPVKLNGDEKFKYLFEQKLKGDQELYTAYTADESVLISFSSKYAGETIEVIDEFTIDVCKEFLNLHNGLFAVNMSDMDSKFDLEIQSHKENDVPLGDNLYKIPFHTDFGVVCLIIGM
jgi:hypothetical protein